MLWYVGVVFFQAEDGIRDLVRSRGLGDVYKRQVMWWVFLVDVQQLPQVFDAEVGEGHDAVGVDAVDCLLYTSDAADERSSVDLGGRRIIKKNKLLRAGSQTVHIATKKQLST